MKETETYLKISVTENELAFLKTSLFSSLMIKKELLDFYENNPDGLILTPLDVLKEDYETLKKLYERI